MGVTPEAALPISRIAVAALSHSSLIAAAAIALASSLSCAGKDSLVVPLTKTEGERAVAIARTDARVAPLLGPDSSVASIRLWARGRPGGTTGIAARGAIVNFQIHKQDGSSATLAVKVDVGTNKVVEVTESAAP